MNTVAIFGLIVRTVGLILVVALTILIFPGLLSIVVGGPAVLAGLLFYAVPLLFFGLWLLRGASSLVAFAYPDETKNRWFVAEPGRAMPPPRSRL